MKKTNIKKYVVTAMLSAVAFVLMFIDFPTPLMPSFIKMDISEMPALIASFALGPWWGVIVCFVKNLLNLFLHGQTGGIGELCNFLMGISFVLPAGYIYKVNKTKKNAMVASLIGSVIMAVCSLPINYFISYPIYERIMSLDAIIGMYRVILPTVKNLFECLLIFNAPFTLVKGILCSVITFLVYKKISGFIKN